MRRGVLVLVVAVVIPGGAPSYHHPIIPRIHNCLYLVLYSTVHMYVSSEY